MRQRDLRPLGRRIAGKRVEKDLTQQQLAELAGVTQYTITMIEAGRRAGFNVLTLISIAEALDVGLDYLVYGESR